MNDVDLADSVEVDRTARLKWRNRARIAGEWFVHAYCSVECTLDLEHCDQEALLDETIARHGIRHEDLPRGRPKKPIMDITETRIAMERT